MRNTSAAAASRMLTSAIVRFAFTRSATAVRAVDPRSRLRIRSRAKSTSIVNTARPFGTPDDTRSTRATDSAPLPAWRSPSSGSDRHLRPNGRRIRRKNGGGFNNTTRSVTAGRRSVAAMLGVSEHCSKRLRNALRSDRGSFWHSTTAPAMIEGAGPIRAMCRMYNRPRRCLAWPLDYAHPLYRTEGRFCS